MTTKKTAPAPAPAPAPDLDPASWFCWALDQFNLFDRAPRPSLAKMLTAVGHASRDQASRDAVSVWIPKFTIWLHSAAANERTRTTGQFLLRSWNSSLTVEGAGALELVYGGMDETNRRGVRTVLEFVRYF